MRDLLPHPRPEPGELLRWWRKHRGLSQMALALEAGISPRHMSFLETGRSRPGREVLLQLADVLEMPFRETNALLESAGYARRYGESSLDEDALERLRGMLEFVLERYEPFGAVVVDAEWRLLMSNDAHRWVREWMLGEAAGDVAAEPNLLVQLFMPGGYREHLANWPEVAWHLLERLRRQVAENPARDGVRDLLARLEAMDPPEPPERRPPDLPVLPMHFRVGDRDLRLVSLITTFGAPQDVAVQELRLEAFLPADDETERLIRELAS